ncbi:MAG TPA: hypothetical protein IAC46_04645 [Candidatus Onthoplasma faecigallinarum]|nr:hypothetical protein [Candidatus Onthoplasma faecigallinarum]
MRKNQQEIIQNIMKVGKRIAITILCCVPFLIAIGYLLRNVITSNAVQILLFMLIMGIAVLIEELIARKRERRRQAKIELEGDKDVFK